jgi:3-dehydroquinate dehydratase-1
MGVTRTITVDGRPAAGGRLPLLCAPLVGRTAEAVLAEAAAVAAKGPDLVEWRVDFFGPIDRTGEVIAVARQVKALVAPAPLLFTRRAAHEGGERIPLDESQVVALYQAVCAAACVDLVDYELSNPEEHRAAIREAAHGAGLGLVVSFHDFQGTPSFEELLDKLRSAERAGADVAKIAVMPQGLEDVLTLLSATLRARRELGIPVITMSMGAHGSLTRLFGWVFGSCVTFGVGQSASAPGQVPIEDLRAVNEILRRALGDEGGCDEPRPTEAIGK